MLLSCCLAMGFLMLPGHGTPAEGPAPPSAYDIEVILDERFLNRALLEGIASLPRSVALRAGRLDLHAGGRADFAVQVAAGPLHPMFRGIVVFRATESGGLRVALSSVRLGRVPVTRFVPAQWLEDLNRDLSRQLMERTDAAGVRLIGVTSDENALHFYLVSVE